jgi:beta-lactam-binding protein with PASTA domain
MKRILLTSLIFYSAVVLSSSPALAALSTGTWDSNSSPPNTIPLCTWQSISGIMSCASYISSSGVQWSISGAQSTGMTEGPIVPYNANIYTRTYDMAHTGGVLRIIFFDGETYTANISGTSHCRLWYSYATGQPIGFDQGSTTGSGTVNGYPDYIFRISGTGVLDPTSNMPAEFHGTADYVKVEVFEVSQSVTVPNVVGLTNTAAENAITAAGLEVGVWDSEYNSLVPINYIISQDPPVGTSVPVGSSVTLTTSLGPGVIVPAVAGMAIANAKSAVIAAGLNAGFVLPYYSTTVPVGSVISTSPAAGTTVAQGKSILFYVSQGPQMAKVPNVVGLTQANAGTAITSAGLTTGTITQAYSSTVASGNVISQSLASGTSVVLGTAVNLTVSMGPKPIVYVTVPNVSGMTTANAKYTVKAAGLNAGLVLPFHTATVPVGIVINTSPVAGASVAQGTSVLFWYSVGP